MNPILIIGARGQIGTELSQALISQYGEHQVILSDIMIAPDLENRYESIDILNKESIELLIKNNNIKTVINLAAVLSAVGEKNPTLTWQVNVDGLLNVLELARVYKFKLFQPSSIAVFGPDIPKNNVTQNTPLHPTTMYGVTKVSGEALCAYYASHYNVDVRSVRFPGVIGGHAMPGGGTTDYAVEIFHKAITDGSFTCYLKSDTLLPMIYMDDAIHAIIKIMNSPASDIKVRTSYNINSLTFTPAELYAEIKKHIPHFTIAYKPDHRQNIADSWPASLSDYEARRDWNWEPKITLEAMTLKMIDILKSQQPISN